LKRASQHSGYPHRGTSLSAQRVQHFSSSGKIDDFVFGVECVDDGVPARSIRLDARGLVLVVLWRGARIVALPAAEGGDPSREISQLLVTLCPEILKKPPAPASGGFVVNVGFRAQRNGRSHYR